MTPLRKGLLEPGLIGNMQCREARGLSANPQARKGRERELRLETRSSGRKK